MRGDQPRRCIFCRNDIIFRWKAAMICFKPKGYAKDREFSYDTCKPCMIKKFGKKLAMHAITQSRRASDPEEE